MPTRSVGKYSVYFSHSWRAEDVDLNQAAWEALCPDCNLMVDEDTIAEPPYFVSRIEQYIRRSDLFVAVLTFRGQPSDRVKQFAALAGKSADCDTRCSEASLFEVRLAERARKPRLVLFDPRTKFVPGSSNSSHVKYCAFEPSDLSKQHSTHMKQEIEEWLRNLRQGKVEPRILKPNQNALLLLSRSQDHADLVSRLTSVLENEGYMEVREIPSTWTDSRVVNSLFSSSLLVADVVEAAVWDIYAMAHALFVPTIRLARSATADLNPDLPWLLRGHPYGYQADLVRWASLDDLAQAVAERTAAMRDSRIVINSYEIGRDFLERRRFPTRHRVFISHNLEGAGLATVDAIVAALQARSISCWEYHTQNRTGDSWKEKMKEELEEATHAVIILAEGDDSSTICDDELTYLVQKGALLLPFFYGNRRYTNPKIDRKGLHIEALRTEPKEAGAQVASALLKSLAGAAGRGGLSA
ncbi:MAG: TIR domain-containing protein [Verrucomicrobiales bacterium]|nr:TIR domain-containing protein [Verrucomicrobiales bacterium]